MEKPFWILCETLNYPETTTSENFTTAQHQYRETYMSLNS